MYRTLVRNIASNWVGFAVHAVVAFFLTPFVLESLGDERYGIWALVIGLTGYYGFLDLGFRAGVTQYLARQIAVKDKRGLNETASTAVAALSACGLLLMVMTIALAGAVPYLFTLSDSVALEMRWCIVLIGISLSFQFCLFPHAAVLTALQRFDLANLVGVATRILSAIATLLALSHGYGLFGLSVVHAGFNLLDYVARFVVARRLLPDLCVSWRNFSRKQLRSIAGFGIWNVMIQGSERLIFYSDQIVIGLFLPIAAIAPYSLAVSLADYFCSFFRPVGMVFFPAATQLDAAGDTGRLKQMYLVGTKLLFQMAAVVAILSIAWSADFFRLWVGDRFTDGTTFTSVPLLYGILVAAAVCTVGQRIGYQVMLGTRRVRALAIVVACEGVANLVLSISLIRPLGLLGVALGTVIPAIVFQLIVQPIILCRTLKIPAGKYLTAVYPRTLLVALGTMPIVWEIQRWATPAENWLQLLVQGGLAAVFAAVWMILVGLDREERGRLVLSPIRRLGIAGS